MACGSCGQRSQPAPATATAIPGKRPTYTVIEPSGSTASFDDYLEAKTYQRQVNGTLTTST